MKLKKAKSQRRGEKGAGRLGLWNQSGWKRGGEKKRSQGMKKDSITA